MSYAQDHYLDDVITRLQDKNEHLRTEVERLTGAVQLYAMRADSADAEVERLKAALRYAREQIDGNTYGRTAGLKKIDEALGEQAKVWTQEEIDAETARSDDDWSCREAPNGTAEG